MTSLGHLAYNWIAETLASRRRRATIGRYESDNVYTIDVPGKPNMVFVTYENDTIGEAYISGMSRVAGAPVIVDLVQGRPTVIGVNDVLMRSGIGTNGSLETAPPHTHALGSGLEYPIEGRRMEPGLVMVYTSMTVRIRPFWYWSYGTLKLFSETYLDLTSYVPASSGTHLLALVGVNPETGSTAVVTGSAVPVNMTLTIYDIAAIRPNYMIPLATVRLTNGMSAISDEGRFMDARTLYTPDFGTGGNLATIAYAMTLPASKNHLWLGPVTVNATLTVNGKLKVTA